MHPFVGQALPVVRWLRVRGEPYVERIEESSGQTEWSHALGCADTYSCGHAIAIDPWGNALVAGSFTKPLNINGSHLVAVGKVDALLLKISGP